MSTETKRPQNGHSETSEVKTLTSEMRTLDSRDYSEKAYVYKIRGARTHGGPLHLEIGEGMRVLINEGVRMAYLMDKSVTPLPLELVIADGEKKLYCGRKFEIEKDVTDTEFAHRIEKAMEEYGIGFFSVLRDDWAPFVYVSFGRRDEAEYFASVHYNFSLIDEEVF